MKILLAVDIHHAGAAAVIREGVRWAESTRSTLDLAFIDEFAYDSHLIHDPGLRDLLEEQWGAIQASHRAELTRLMHLVPEALRGELVYLRGRPHEELVKAAEGYDALAIATHGRTGIAHFFMGSVAERVVRSSPVPVIVLRLPAEAS